MDLGLPCTLLGFRVKYNSKKVAILISITCKVKTKGKKLFLVLDFLIGLKKKKHIFLTGNPEGPSLVHSHVTGKSGPRTQKEQLKSSLKFSCGSDPHGHSYTDGFMGAFPFGKLCLQRS